MRKRQDDLTVEEFFDLAGLIVKTYLQKTYNKKIVYLKKKAEETREKVQNQQYWRRISYTIGKWKINWIKH